MARELSVKQRRFADAYLGEAKGNGTKAAEIAGYKDPVQAGYENKIKQEVRAYIDARLAAETASSAEVLHELTDIGFAEWRDFVDIRMADGQIVDVKMDLSSKVKALELLGKYHRLWDADHVTGNTPAVVIHIDTLPGRLRPALEAQYQIAAVPHDD